MTATKIQTEAGDRLARTGGTLEMVQLWVNLPAKDKLAAPGYQTLLDAEIPSVALADEAGRVRVIAGEFDGHRGPALDRHRVRQVRDRHRLPGRIVLRRRPRRAPQVTHAHDHVP